MRSLWTVAKWHAWGAVFGALAFTLLMKALPGSDTYLFLAGVLSLATIISMTPVAVPFLLGWLALARRIPRLERDAAMRIGILAAFIVVFIPIFIVVSNLQMITRSWTASDMEYFAAYTIPALAWLVVPRLVIPSLRRSLLPDR